MLNHESKHGRDPQMIHLEYDVQTSGVRVSFVADSGHEDAMRTVDEMLKHARSKIGMWEADQNIDTMKILIKMLNHEIKHALLL